MKCNAGKFLFNNRCRDSCDGTSLIAYAPGNYGRAPFSCTDRADESGRGCKCSRAVGDNNCLVCDYGAGGATCSRCTDSMYLYSGACVLNCPSGSAAVGSDRDGHRCLTTGM